MSIFTLDLSAELIHEELAPMRCRVEVVDTRELLFFGQKDRQNWEILRVGGVLGELNAQIIHVELLTIAKGSHKTTGRLLLQRIALRDLKDTDES